MGKPTSPSPPPQPSWPQQRGSPKGVRSDTAPSGGLHPAREVCVGNRAEKPQSKETQRQPLPPFPGRPCQRPPGGVCTFQETGERACTHAHTHTHSCSGPPREGRQAELGSGEPGRPFERRGLGEPSAQGNDLHLSRPHDACPAHSPPPAQASPVNFRPSSLEDEDLTPRPGVQSSPTVSSWLLPLRDRWTLLGPRRGRRVSLSTPMQAQVPPLSLRGFPTEPPFPCCGPAPCPITWSRLPSGLGPSHPPGHRPHRTSLCSWNRQSSAYL